MKTSDVANWKAQIRLEKRIGDINQCRTPEERLKFLEETIPYEVIESEGNLLLNVGINETWNLVVGARPAGTAWATGVAYALGAIVVPTAAKYCTSVYECTTAGTSAATEPVWVAVDGATVADGTALVWTCRSDPRVFKFANAKIGVGDSATAAAATDTDLLAATNKLYKGQEAGFPTVGTQKVTFKSSFGATEANYAWAEWVIKSTAAIAPTNICLNRKVEALGTKATGTWTLEVAVTLS